MGFLTLIDSIASEYLRMLNVIYNIYFRYELEYDDFYDDIIYYQNKNTSETLDPLLIQELIKRCTDEWKTLLTKICKNLIDNVELNEEYKPMLRIELKKVKKIYQKIKHDRMLPDEYEKIFNDELDPLKDDVEVKLYEKKHESKTSRKNLFYSGFIGFLIGLLFYFLK